MKKQRMLVGAVLTAGLGLTSLVSANASGATAPSAKHPTTATVIGSLPGKGGGQVAFCIVKGGPGAGKGAAGKAAAVGKGEKKTVKVVNGKVYVDGTPVPKGKVDTKCPELPPLPPLGPGHKGGTTKGGTTKSGTAQSGTVVQGSTGAGSEAGVTTSGAATAFLRG